jgi:precorrin-3B synthase
MNAPLERSMRRGACPGLLAPMATGDGLLARLTPTGSTIPLDAFTRLCAAARAQGNGIIEITSRGSIQIRGLRAASAPLFAADAALLGIGIDGIPVVTDPLSGLDADGMLDANMLAAGIQIALAAASFADRVSAKISIVVDGGGALHLDALAADVRLRAIDARTVHVALGGDAETARSLGAVARERTAECTLRLLETLAAMAPHARMREAIQGQGWSALKSAIGSFVVGYPAPATRAAAEPIGVHVLRDGRCALGIGLPFGHSDSETLSHLVYAARRAGASGLRTCPGRTLLLVGVTLDAAEALLAEAGARGFIVDPADPRRRVVACAGAPICASGEIPARAIAPAIADAARPWLDGEIVHVSGCAKGCAHPAPAPVTVIGRHGRCDVLLDGVLSCSVTVDDLPDEIAQLARAGKGGDRR